MGASASLKATLDVAQAIVGLRDEEKMRLKAIELTGKIIDAQQAVLLAQAAQAELAEREKAARDDLMKMKDWDREKRRYQLIEVATGVFVYETKSGMENGEPAHKICAACYQHGRKSILQLRKEADMASIKTHVVCQACGADLITKVEAQSYSGLTQRHPRGIV